MSQRKREPLSWVNGCQMASVCTHLHNLLKLSCRTGNINIFASGRMLNQVNETLLRKGSLCTHSCDTRYLFLAEGRNNECFTRASFSLLQFKPLQGSFSLCPSLFLSLPVMDLTIQTHTCTQSHTHTHIFSWCSLSPVLCAFSYVPSDRPLLHLQIPLHLWWTDMQRIL